ncbi:undecaprenyl pyrophosphate synthetase [Staphylococcus aureus]|uniref:Undecaprenyl pyrophosphate synthetase n=1 Tax=Staphylococcus aureus TaxID=1280 RepID=A0A2X2M9D8_STAAU|nr:undecaprenyl pyrophosphate synthetase [Staphylococcus aureus]
MLKKRQLIIPALKLIFAINYGGRAELVHSIKNMFDELHQQGLNSDIIDENIYKQSFNDKRLS